MPRKTKNKGTSATYQIFSVVDSTVGDPANFLKFSSCDCRCCGVVWNQALLPGMDDVAANGLNEAVELTAAGTNWPGLCFLVRLFSGLSKWSSLVDGCR